MSDLSIPPSGVSARTGSILRTVTVNEVIDRGETVYRNGVNDHRLAHATGETEANVLGICVQGASSGEDAIVCTNGPIYLDISLPITNVPYTQSQNAGKIAPASDLVSNDYITHLGYSHGAGGTK